MTRSHTDQSEHKRLDEAIRQAEKRFSQAFHASPVPIVMLALADGRYFEVNDAWLRLMGFSRSEAIGHTSLEMKIWAVPEQRSEFYTQLNTNGFVRNEEYLARTKSGEVRTILLSAETLELNSEPYLLCYLYDITERKHAEEELRARETQLSLIHENVYDAIFAIGIEPDNQFRFTGVNQRFLDVTGLSKDQVVGKLVQEVIPESAHKLVLEKYQEAIQTQQPTHWEEVSAYPSGTKVGQITVAPICDGSGNCTQLIGTAHDITEIRQAQQVLEKRVAERTHELAALNEIAAVVSRSLDLKEILTAALNKAMEIMQMEFGAAYGIQEGTGPVEVTFVGHAPPQSLSAYMSQHNADFLQVPVQPNQLATESEQPSVWMVVDHSDTYIRQALQAEGVVQIIHVPLFTKGKLVGRFALGARHEKEIKPEELALLSSIGRQIAVAVENAILYNQAEQSAASAERQRLSRELHDSVTQSLYSVTMYAEAAARQLEVGDTVTASYHLRELRDTAQEALREMRLLIFELRPLVLEKIGLVAALQARLDSVEARGGTQSEMKIDGVLVPDRLPRFVEEELYHIAQEVLNNVLKHSHALHTRVYLHFSDAETVLEICDDGVGFEPGSAGSSGGLGLASLKERAQKIGAKLSIESTPGNGTQIRVVVPAISTIEKHPEQPDNKAKV